LVTIFEARDRLPHRPLFSCRKWELHSSLLIVTAAMSYKQLSKDDFDAIVTGELTHYAIWLESELIEIIADRFARPDQRVEFTTLVLRRDGLTFQDKIEIVRAMTPSFANRTAADRLKQLLPKIEEFKSNRNAFAHGLDVTPPDGPPGELRLEIIGRSGKGKVITVTCESHEAMMKHADQLLEELRSVRSRLST
jgi:hypothetical protein